VIFIQPIQLVKRKSQAENSDNGDDSIDPFFSEFDSL